MDKERELCKENKKIVFFDIDDTLYSLSDGVPASATEGIKRLREAGHEAWICTGRSYAMIFPSIKEIGFDGVIAGGGTYIETNREVVFRKDMDGEEAAYVTQKLREFGFLAVPEGHDCLYYEPVKNWSETYKNIYGKFMGEIGHVMKEIPLKSEGMCAAKVGCVFTEESRLDLVEKEFDGKYTIVNHNNVLLELIPIGYSKAEGIKRVLSLKNMKRDDTCAFGDSMNDYEMLDFVKYSIAMGNSCEKIKSVAWHVTDRIENDGIYKGLKYMGLI